VKPIGQTLDDALFVKQGYAFVAHVVPFGLVALLLLLVSVAAEDPLRKILKALERPSIWPLAAILTAVTVSLYFFIVLALVRRAYLFDHGVRRRTALTSLLFLVLCTLIAYAVLKWAVPGEGGRVVRLWSCLLFAALSLDGIGWTRPSRLVDDLGIRSPDYIEARRLVGVITEAFVAIRKEPRGTRQDIESVLKSFQGLLSEVEKNLNLEPPWAKPGMTDVRYALAGLLEAVNAAFSKADDQTAQDFALAINCKKEFQYPKVIDALRAASTYFPRWACT
jgi:hypothetical protein